MRRIRIGYTKALKSLPRNGLRVPAGSVGVTLRGRAHSLTCLNLVALDQGPHLLAAGCPHPAPYDYVPVWAWC